MGLGTDVATSGAESACGIPLRSGLAGGAAGVLGLVHASSTDAVVVRAINAVAKATVIGFLLEAIFSCLRRGFMTRRCYTTREHDDGGCHYATAVAVVIGTNSRRCHGRTAVGAVNCLGRLSLPLRRRGW